MKIPYESIARDENSENGGQTERERDGGREGAGRSAFSSKTLTTTTTTE